MANTQDFDALWQRAAKAWAVSKVKDGADNVDAYRTNKIFSDYYDQYGLHTNAGTLTYNTTTKKMDVVGVYSQTYTNDTDKDASGTFTYSDAIADTISVSVTEAIKITMTANVKVSLEGLGEASASLSVDASLSSTQTVTNTETRTWSVNQTIPEPPHSVTKATFTIEKNTLAGSVSAPLVISGRVAIGLNSRWNGHYFWFVPIASLLTETNNAPHWLKINSDGSVTFTSVASVNGVVASNAYLKIERPNQSAQTLEVVHPNAQLLARN